MAKSRVKQEKLGKNQVLVDAQEAVFEYIECNKHVDLSRTGMAWAGILDLEKPVSPSEVAAMLSTYDIIRATTMVDSHSHWVTAVAFAVLADAADASEKLSSSKDTEVPGDDKPLNVIGFTASNKNDS